jgi:peptide/nickel transport system substrate-binding protein
MANRRFFLTRLPAAVLAAAAVDPVRAALAATTGRSVTIAYPMDVASWDPVVAANPTTSAIYKCVFDQPLELAPQLGFADSVVSSHRWLAPDCTVLELNFRPGITFHNGDKLTSDDFKFTFYDRVQLDKATLLAGVWGKIARIDTPTPLQAVVHFREPMATAPVMFADIPAYILPRAYYERVGKAGFEAKPVGSGPYRLVEYQRDQRIVLEAWDGYWKGPARVRRVVFQIIKDQTSRAAALQTGADDVAVNLPVRDAERLGAMPGMEAHLDPSTGVVLIQMVNKGVFTDRNVRLAAHHAIDKPMLSRALFGGHATPIWLPAGPGMPGYVPGFTIPYDVAKARSLLALSGYGAGKPVRCKFYTTKGAFPNDFDIARAVVQMWQRVGIEAELQVLEAPMMYDYQNSGKFDGPVLKPFNPAGGDPGTYSGYMLDPKVTFSIWKSADIPPRLYPLMAEPDQDKRYAGFRRFDQWQVEQGYSLPLFLGLTTVVARKTLGFTPQRSGVLAPYSWT